MLTIRSVLYHALCILLYRPSLSSKNPITASHATRTCTFHSKSILSVLDLYERTFPYRLMTYQVSYCVFTAATAQAYVMRHSDGEVADEAAKTLSSAMRILHQETNHTPGISGSLDTIRRQLMMGTPSGRKRERLGAMPDEVPGPQSPEIRPRHATAALDVEHLCQVNEPNATMSAASVTENDPQSLSVHRYDMHTSQEQGFGIGIGGIDTGAGFHPNAFPWVSTDWPGAENWLESGWMGQARGWGESEE